MFKRVVALLLRLLAGIAGGTLHGLAAPETFVARTWLVDDGLPHNAVTRIVQDGRGFLWLATTGGLARFDGHQMTEVPIPSAQRGASLNVRDIAVEDASTLVLLPASGGIVRLRDGVFMPHPLSGAFDGAMLLNLYVEPSGVLWLSVTGNRIARCEGTQVQMFDRETGFVRRSGRTMFACDGSGTPWIASGDFLARYEHHQLVRVGENLGSSLMIAPSRDGGMWISTQSRLLKWRNGRFDVVCDERAWTPAAANVQQLFEDRAGTLWIPTRQGLYRYTDRAVASVATSHPQINSVMEDVEGNVWVATAGGGVDRLREKTFVLLNSATGFPDDVTTSVTEDDAGNLWCANRLGGVVRWHQGDVRAYKPASGESFIATNVCADGNGDIWAGAINGLYRIRCGSDDVERVDASIRPVRVIAAMRNGDVWVGWGETQANGYALGRFVAGEFHAFDAAEGFEGLHVVSMAEANDGTVWLASGDGDVWQFSQGKFSRRIGVSESPGGRALTVHVDSRGGLWIGTMQGLVLKRGERLALLSRAQGLPDDFISQTIEDGRGRLWLCSRRGFFCVALDQLYAVADARRRTVAATTFGREEGLPGLSAPTGGHPMSWRGRDGRVWFVTSRGVAGFDPEASLPPRPIPPVYIDGAEIDGAPAPVANGRLEVPPGAHQLKICLVAVNFSAADKIRLRHQLVGFDPNWIETDADRSATYSRLPPGRYRFKATAANQDGVWNEAGTTLEIAVVPAWWQAWWLRLTVVAMFTALVVWLARRWSHRRLRAKLERLERENALERERARIARDLHDELGGSLTQIGMLAERARRHTHDSGIEPVLGQLAWRTRRLSDELESIVWTVNPRNDTWDKLASFIDQYARSFFRDTPVGCGVSGIEQMPSVALAPEAQHNVLSVMKEALNNVLKHARATRVSVELIERDGWFEMRIEDNGAGFDPSAPELREGNGLTNMRARMSELAGEIEIGSRPGGGTRIIVRCALAAAPHPRSTASLA